MQKLFAIFCIGLLACSMTTVSARSCKALVIAGGADLGSYEAGVIQGLVQAYNELGQVSEVYWDVISGVSVGAITAVGLGQFPKEQTVEMANWVVNLWENISKSDVYSNYLGGIVQGFLFEESLFKTDPLRAFLKKNVTRKQTRKLVIGVTNANTGEFERYNESLSNADLIEAVMCSSAVPAFFPYQIFKGNTYFDGGVIRTTDVYGAIERCKELVDDVSQITIDVILVTAKTFDQDVPDDLKPIKVGTLSQKIKDYRNARRALLEAYEAFPTINWRHIINPQTKLPDADFPFNFNHKQLLQMIAQGNTEGRAAVQQHVQYESSRNASDDETSNLSLSAKLAIMDAYESVFDRYNISYNKTTSA
ncbi:hypothetical protein ABPG72_000273 [Tetrahymena utriculariae]